MPGLIPTPGGKLCNAVFFLFTRSKDPQVHLKTHTFLKAHVLFLWVFLWVEFSPLFFSVSVCVLR